MKIGEAMTSEVMIASPSQSIQEAARLMAKLDAGSLPVGENDRLVGMVTDRDIAVRAVARGLNPDTPVSKVMSGEVLYCFDDEDVKDVADNMAEQKLRRLPVVNRQKRLVGIVLLGDIVRADNNSAAHAMSRIVEPGGLHSQGDDGWS